jgi:protocatechuate 3,4-dioxygenase beta subunit
MRRRNLIVLGGAAVIGAGATAWWKRNEVARWALTRTDNQDVRLSDAPDLDQANCLLTPEQTEGPFFIRAPVRADIREDRAGLPLLLRVQVVEADGCTPVPDAVVEIWHCDAAGRYSGYPEHLSRRPLDTLLFVRGAEAQVPPTNEKTYLRGAQVSDARGLLAFQTIFPGWYEPRVTHIHVKVFRQGRSYLTTQLYFPDEFVRDLYSTHADYVAHGTSPYHHGNDAVLGQYPDGTGLLIRPRRAAGGLEASARLGLG